MKLRTFTAGSASDALAEIRRELGPEAVVVHVRRVGGEGISRLWQKPVIEVVACVPDPPQAPALPAVQPPAPAVPATLDSDSLAQLKRELAEIRGLLPQHAPAPSTQPAVAVSSLLLTTPALPASIPEPSPGSSGWVLENALIDTGVSADHAAQIMRSVAASTTVRKPSDLKGELKLAMPALKELWDRRNAFDPDRDETRRHVFIGPPGSGKTTVLCKWMTMEVLMNGRKARVWRLDGAVANSAEMLSVYSEVLGASVERVWHPVVAAAGSTVFDLDFIDLPGVESGDVAGLTALQAQLKEYQEARVHLVLNAAYELTNLFAQLRAYSGLGVHDLILTHLDEELRWGKLWNILLGTNCRIRFLSAGQNIPGDFHSAESSRILSRQLVCNQ